MYDLKKDTNISIGFRKINSKANIEPNGKVWGCPNYVCSKYGTKVDFSFQSGCPAFIGNSCDVLDAVFVGKPIAKYICKAGVFLACWLSVHRKECLEYRVDGLTVGEL